jgi:hypothetical protein
MAKTRRTRGKGRAGMINAEKLNQLLLAKRHLVFVAFMESLYVPGLDLTRESDRGPDIEV